jgi:hypothetical protein
MPSAVYRLKICQDDNPTSTREYDNLGTMLCWHDRYHLGDNAEDVKRDTVEATLLTIIAGEDPKFEERLAVWKMAEYELRSISKLEGDAFWQASGKLDEEETERVQKKFASIAYVLPLFLYDHSGITMSTSRFGCPWDSGQVGFIYVLKSKIRAEYASEKSKPPRKKTILSMLEGEVALYDKCLTNDVYGFIVQKFERKFELPDETIDIQDDDLDWEDGDSCWGFYGHDIKNNGMLDHLGKARLTAAKEAIANLDTWVECPESD